MKRTVTDEITNYKEWEKGDLVTITAGTGAGKSHFIKNKLYIHAKLEGKKILMLVHRLNCLDQFQYEIQKEGKTDVITLGTYQSIQYHALQGVKSNTVNPSDFDYVICDEFHYFMSDASFNIATDLSLKAVLDATDSIRIFTSATGDYVERYLQNYLKKDIISYPLPIKFNFIKTLTFYNKDETLNYYIETAIKKKKKAIFFIESATKAYELHKMYENYSLFNCGKSHELYKHVDEKKIKRMLKEEKFHDLILFTTTAMDAGVNIHDVELQNIICDVSDPIVMQQCIGRKRLQHKDDYIHLIVKGKNNQQLGALKGRINTRLRMADFLREYDTKSLIREFPRQSDGSKIIYDKWENDKLVKEVNELSYFKHKVDIHEIDEMLSYGKYGYCKFIAHRFGFYDEDNDRFTYSIEEDKAKADDLERYLDSVVGKELYKEEQKELIDRVDVRVNGRQQRSYKKINEGLEMIKLPYVILPKRTEKLRFWKLEKFDL